MVHRRCWGGNITLWHGGNLFFIWRPFIIFIRLKSPSPSMLCLPFYLTCIPFSGISLLGAVAVPSQAGEGSWEKEKVTACGTRVCNTSAQISHFVTQSKEHIFNSVSNTTICHVSSIHISLPHFPPWQFSSLYLYLKTTAYLKSVKWFPFVSRNLSINNTFLPYYF